MNRPTEPGTDCTQCPAGGGRAALLTALMLVLALALCMTPAAPAPAATTNAQGSSKSSSSKSSASRAGAKPGLKPRPTAVQQKVAAKARTVPTAAAPEEDALPMIAKSLQVPDAEVGGRDVHLLADGRSFAPREVNPRLIHSLIMARRTGGTVRQWPGRGPWKIAPRQWLGGGRSRGSASGASATPIEPAAGTAAVEAPAQSDSDKAYSLPYVFRAIAKDPDSKETRPVSFEAVVVVLKDLRYQESSRRFEAQIAVGLTNLAQPADRSVLGDPLSLLISANAEVVEPTKLQISQLGDPQIVNIAAVSPSTPFFVSAGTIGEEGDKLEIPVERPQLTVLPAQQEIEGWGLAKTVLQIQVPGVSQAGGRAITLSTTQGEIIPTPVHLDVNGQAKATLRSDGTGTATITAVGDPFQRGTASVQFALPRNFVIATLVGALLGWIVKNRARQWSVGSLLVAFACSSILTAAYAIGIHWLKWAPEAGAGEALTFFVAAMGAYLGVRVLKRIGDGEESEA